MRGKDNGKRGIPKDVWFAIFFAGSFLPNIFGRVSAALGGMVLSLYLLGLMRGKKRYVLAACFPIVCCIAVRVASNYVYLFMVDARTRAEVAVKFYGVKDVVVHYFHRTWETVLSLKGVGMFFETGEFSSLLPLWRNVQFVLIIVAILVCLGAVLYRKSA